MRGRAGGGGGGMVGKGIHETFECRGPYDAQINCSEYVSLPDLLSLGVPDVTSRVNKPN